MNKIPFQVKDINNPQELFGRQQLIDKLIVAAQLKQNVNIIGARRFGKTCVLKTMYTVLRNDMMNIAVYPVYLDVKATDIHKNTGDVYRYFIGKLVECLYKDHLFTEPEKFGRTELSPSDDWADIIEDLKNLSTPKAQSLFERIVKWFSEFMEKTILFMIDEYEYLFIEALEKSSGFMMLRKLSADSLENGLRPFCFWLTGATTWETLIQKVPGSGEANTISYTDFVTPLTKDEFHKMWIYECEMIEDVAKKSLLLSSEAFAYEKSGGVAFYGKNVIAAYIYSNGCNPDYTICQSYFSELTSKALNHGSYKLLKELASGPKKLIPSKTRDDLEKLGIIKAQSKGYHSLSIGFLTEFIKSELADASVPQGSQTDALTKDITDLIEKINNQRKNHNQQLIFPPVTDSASLEYKLRTPCKNKDQLSDFASALYKYYFERLKQVRQEFSGYFYGKFTKCVDIARHSFGGGHEMDFFNQYHGQLTRADLLTEIMGNADELSSPQEYQHFQIEMLKRFKTTLTNLFNDLKQGRI